MLDNAIFAEGLTVVRSKKVILDALTFELKPGIITGLIGPSGSGKTTLMRAIVGAQVITGGKLGVLGKPAGSAELRSKIGYVTQSPAIYDDLTVAQNLAYFAAVLGVGKDDIQRVITQVDLQAQTKQLAVSLSGGQRARVSLAIALLGKAELLVLDEPTVGLDPVLRQSLWALFSDLAKQGVTLLVSSHVMEEADKCDDILLLREGKIVSHSTREELLKLTTTSDVESAFLALVQKGNNNES